MHDRKPSDSAERIVVRLPDGMRERLAALAKSNGRSSNAEVVKALDIWISQAEWVAASSRGEKTGPWPSVVTGVVPAIGRQLPESLREQLVAAAKSNHRSVAEELTARVQATFERQAPHSAMPTVEALRAARDTLAFVLANEEALATALGERGEEVPWGREPKSDPKQTAVSGHDETAKVPTRDRLRTPVRKLNT